MDRDEYKRQAVGLADLVRSRHDSDKTLPTYTLWTLAFHWTGEQVGESSVTNPYRDFIPATFRDFSPEKPHLPEVIVPRATSIIGHYTCLALANRDLLEKVYAGALAESNYPHTAEVISIVSDARLVSEILMKYVEFKESQALAPEIDLFDFLLRYNVKKNALQGTNRVPKGTYLPLATRLVHRYGEKGLEEGIFKLVSSDLADKVRLLHRASASFGNDYSLDRELLEVYDRYKPEDNGNADPTQPKKIKSVEIGGKRRVKVRGNSISVNWQVVAEERRRRVLTYHAFSPKEVVLARAERGLTLKYKTLYMEHFLSNDIDPILAEIDQNLTTAGSSYEKEVLERVRKKFALLGKFDLMESIHHSMPVRRGRRSY